jgi:hypothetical protein
MGLHPGLGRRPLHQCLRGILGRLPIEELLSSARCPEAGTLNMFIDKLGFDRYGVEHSLRSPGFYVAQHI